MRKLASWILWGIAFLGVLGLLICLGIVVSAEAANEALQPKGPGQ